jgi:serine/threonine protein kinase
MALPNSLEQMATLAAYQDLRKTAGVGTPPIVAVVGAGLSAGAGLPTWSELRGQLVAEVRTRASQARDLSESNRLSAVADKASSSVSAWAAFRILKNELGETTYTSTIASALSLADGIEAPAVYRTLWKGPIAGVLTPNLDPFAAMGFSKAHPGRELKAMTGATAPRLRKVLHSGHPFLVTLHGNTDDPKTWVFTDAELSQLHTLAYKEFMRSIFTAFTVIFLGVSAEDVAIGGPLASLTADEIYGQTHYWVTDRSDHKVREWAERVGIRMLPYDSTHGHAIVGDILNDLEKAIAPEPLAPPVVSSQATGSVTLPPVGELITRPLPEIRSVLNSRARQLLSMDGGDRLYQEFVIEYDQAIHSAWYTNHLHHDLMGNTLVETVRSGAFGQVYKAVDPQGGPIAIKVLLAENRSNTELMKSFRRGVQAMRILGERRVKGMVDFIDASEIPAFVAMEWIEGPDLGIAKDSRLLEEWSDILWASTSLVSVISAAHSLPERVLHRDIRPANIMLRNGWGQRDEWELVVLDFDLSTFEGARQRSVLAAGSALGYLAPEQINPSAKVSTRNAAVDSFGIGMTLLFLCSGREPELHAQMFENFPKRVAGSVSMPEGAAWRSLPVRVGRIIMGATKAAQTERWSIDRILAELQRLSAAQSDPTSVVDPDLIADEIISRCQRIQDFEWNEDQESIEYASASGIRVRIRGKIDSDRVELSIGWDATGMEERSNVSKYMPDRVQRALSRLTSGGWRISSKELGSKSVLIRASLTTRDAWNRLDSASAALDDTVGYFQFS